VRHDLERAPLCIGIFNECTARDEQRFRRPGWIYFFAEIDKFLAAFHDDPILMTPSPARFFGVEEFSGASADLLSV